MDVNLKGPFFLSGVIGKKMVARGRGSIINISTTSALMAQPEIGAYCVSKAGLNMVTRAFAREFGPHGVRVNAISCGVIRTAMGDHTLNDPQRYADMMKINPLKRAGFPEEVMLVVRWATQTRATARLARAQRTAARRRRVSCSCS